MWTGILYKDNPKEYKRFSNSHIESAFVPFARMKAELKDRAKEIEIMLLKLEHWIQ
jgi:hypothetical protein